MIGWLIIIGSAVFAYRAAEALGYNGLTWGFISVGTCLLSEFIVGAWGILLGPILVFAALIPVHARRRT